MSHGDRVDRGMAIAVAAFVVGYAALWSAVSIYRHEGLNSSGLDLAIYEQVIWNSSQGRLFASSIEVENLLGDHVSPILLVPAPLMWLPGDSTWWLLIFQSVALGSSAWPLFLLVRRSLAWRPWQLVLPLVWLAYPALGFINRFDFHPVALAIPLLAWTCWFVSERRTTAATVTALLAMACREEVGIAVGSLALYAALRPETRKWGIRLAALGFFWSVFAITWLIPHIRGEAPDALARYAWLGGDASSIVWNLLTQPSAVVSHLLAPARSAMLLFLFLPLGFLPFLSPTRLACALPSLLILMLSDHPSMNSIYFQYVSPVIPILAWAAVDGVAVLERRIHGRPRSDRLRVALAGAVGACALMAFLLENPLVKSVRPPMWQVQTHPPRGNVAAFREAHRLLPPDAPVLASMALAPHLARRRELYIQGGWAITRDWPDRVLLDVTDPRWLDNPAKQTDGLSRRLSRPGYGIQYWRDGILLLSRSHSDRSAVPEVLSFLSSYRDGLAAPVRERAPARRKGP
jgi:uncharacterized membrane protein